MDLCNINEIKALLARHGFHFSKAKGQNFLTQSWVPQNIVLESGVDETCGVLEVGPGIGPLTQQLCRYAKKVVAVEVDRTLQPILAETMAGNENLEIIFGDILKTDISALVQEEFSGLRPIACANLPYYITTPVLAALLLARRQGRLRRVQRFLPVLRRTGAAVRRTGKLLHPAAEGHERGFKAHHAERAGLRDQKRDHVLQGRSRSVRPAQKDASERAFIRAFAV